MRFHDHVQLLTAIFFERRIGLENNKQSLNEKSRSLLRAKRRKTNIVLNTLIVIILLLIVVVTVNIFFSDDQTASKSNDKVEDSVKENNSETADALSQGDEEDTNIDGQEKETTSKDNNKESDQNIDKDGDLNSQNDVKDQEVVTEGGSDPEVKKTIVNPAWEPVGTSQTGQHFNEYSGVDWDEMVQAISYGTGIDPGNMTIVFLGNNGPDKSVGTVKQKDTQQVYRVYIEWVDEKGWKPTQVEEMAN
jgi:cytoskeletal protein RodZ